MVGIRLPYNGIIHYGEDSKTDASDKVVVMTKYRHFGALPWAVTTCYGRFCYSGPNHWFK
jgi:hypothetical protein